MIAHLKRRCGWLLVVPLLLSSGCGSGDRLTEVSGVVTLDGDPAPDLLVEFLPDPGQGTHGPRSTARTDREGHFHLVCDDKRDGAVLGFHRILIQDARMFPDPRHDRKTESGLVTPPSRIPDRYRNVANTPLRQEIKAAMPTITLEVTSR